MSQHASPELREIRLMADILALILDHERGQAEAALERIRQRARESQMTGGSLKNLFHSLAATHHITEHLRPLDGAANEEKQRGNDQKEDVDTQHLRQRIQSLTHGLERLSGEHRKLQSQFASLENEAAYLRQKAIQTRFALPLQRASLLFAFLCGAVIGIAMAEVIHAL